MFRARGNSTAPKGTVRLFLIVAALSTPALPGRAEVLPQSEPPDDAQRAYLAANGMLNRGLHELAAVEYRAFLSAHPNHAKAPLGHYGLGVCLFRAGKHAETVAELEPLATDRSFEFAAEVATILGQCHLALEQHQKAAELLSGVVRDFKDHELADDAFAGWMEALHRGNEHDALLEQCPNFLRRFAESPLRGRVEFFCGLSAMTSNNYATAAERFESILSREASGPYSEQAALFLAQCRQHTGDARRAMQGYRDVVERKNPKYVPDALLNWAALLRQEKQLAEAAKLLDQLIAEFPGSHQAELAGFERALVFFELGDFDQAFQRLSKAASLPPELRDDQAYWSAKCRLRQGKDAEAADRMRTAVDQFPNSEFLPEMFYDRAFALLRGGQADEAATVLEAFRARFSDHALIPDSLHLSAVAHHQRRQYDESLRYCREFLDRHAAQGLAESVAFLAAENEFLAGRHGAAAERYRALLDRGVEDSRRLPARFRLGLCLHRLEKPDEALPLLNEAAASIDKSPDYRVALHAVGDIHFQRERYEQAVDAFERYLALEAESSLGEDALLKLGLCLHRLGKSDRAAGKYDELLNRFPNGVHSLQARFERGQARMELNMLDEAASDFEFVLAASDNARFAPHAENHLGAIALRKGEFKAAADRFGKARGNSNADDLVSEPLLQQGQALLADQRFAQAEQVLQEYLDRFGSDRRAAVARAHLAVVRSRLNRCAEAMPMLEQAERESSSELPDALRNAVRYERAWCLQQIGKKEEAATAYRTLVESAEPDIHAMLALAQIEFDDKQFDAAAKLLRKIRESRAARSRGITPPLLERATYLLAAAEYQNQRYAESAELFEELISDFPKSELLPSASAFCGEALFKLGKLERSVTHLSRVVESHPDDPGCAAVMLRLGETLAALQRWTLSETVFGDFLRRFPDSEQWFTARFGVAWAQENQSRYDDAVAGYQGVVDRHKGPTAARAQFQIGECLFAKKQYDEAVREFLKVDILYAYPEWSAAALYEAGRCFEKIGKSTEARAQFSAVATKYGGTRWAELASQRLNELSSAGIPGR